ncbi:hypothetical protein FVA81_03160 (plasmid) [Rhizobium sp. WL3]|nr:hypothetical protein FVA81_03160 [Rhizobium sp. WL3]
MTPCLRLLRQSRFLPVRGDGRHHPRRGRFRSRPVRQARTLVFECGDSNPGGVDLKPLAIGEQEYWQRARLEILAFLVFRLNAGKQITRLIELLKSPVITTVAGKGVVPESHPLSLGSTLQRAPIRRLVEAEADLVIEIGTEISETDLILHAALEVQAMHRVQRFSDQSVEARSSMRLPSWSKTCR